MINGHFSAGPGVEPGFTAPKAGVLPLDDPANVWFVRCLYGQVKRSIRIVSRVKVQGQEMYAPILIFGQRDLPRNLPNRLFYYAL